MSTNPDRPVLLLTGAPGVGKTTVLDRVAIGLAGLHLGGFLTEEIREAGARSGFRLRTFTGETRTIAHTRLPGPRHVGKYGVDVASLDAVAQRALASDASVAAFLVDEIGKMECHSAVFVTAMTTLLGAGRPLVATVARSGEGLIARAKRLPSAELWEVSWGNRDTLPQLVLDWLQVHWGVVPRG